MPKLRDKPIVKLELGLLTPCKPQQLARCFLEGTAEPTVEQQFYFDLDFLTVALNPVSLRILNYLYTLIK